MIKYPLLGLMLPSCLLVDPNSGVDPGVYPLDVGKIMDIEIRRSVAIFCETQNGGRPISGAENQATAMAFGVPRSSCVRPGAHSARHQDSRNDLTPCRIALCISSPPALTRRTPMKRPALRLRGGRRTPLVAYTPSLSCAPPMLSDSTSASWIIHRLKAGSIVI